MDVITESSGAAEMQYDKNKLRIFTPQDEKVNLLIGVILPIFALFDVLFFNLNIQENFTNVITQIIFLDAIHVAFTYVMLASLPEARAWLNQSESFRRSIVTSAAVSWLLTFAVLLLVGLKLRENPDLFTPAVAVVLLAKFALPTWHGTYQMKGLLSAYNFAIKKAVVFTADELRRATLIEKAERMLFRSLLLSASCWFFFSILFPKFVSENFSFLNSATLSRVAWVAICLNVLAILGCAFFYPHSRKSNKFVYSLRLLLFMLFPISPVARVTSGIFHGSEYLFVYRTIRQKSSMTSDLRKKQLGYTVAASLLLFILCAPAYFVAENNYSVWMIVSISLSLAFGYTHYYLDRQLFKMSSLNVRKTIGTCFPESA